MKRRILLVQFCIVCAVITATVSAFAEETIRFVYFNDYAPFGWQENGAMRGLYIDIVNEVFNNRLGIPVEHQGYPWKRAQKMVMDGVADGFCTVITPERLSFSDATQHSIIDVDFKMFVPANSSKLELLRQIFSISRLKGFKLVDYAGSGWADEHLAKAGLDVYWLPRNEQIWRYLLAGRADLTVNNEWTTRYSLKKEGYQDQFVELPQPMAPEPSSFHIFIGKKSSFLPLLNQVDESLKRMKADGTLQRIYEQYK
jgi:polar amino acid transport system substrate-binding protein